MQCYKHWHGLVDFYFPALNLCLQFDGSQHFDGHSMHAHAAGDMQQERDLAFNAAMWQAGVRVVRMHHTDDGVNGKCMVLAALNWCQVNPGRRLLLLSYSFSGIGMAARCAQVLPGARMHADEYGRAWIWDEPALLT